MIHLLIWLENVLSLSQREPAAPVASVARLALCVCTHQSDTRIRKSVGGPKAYLTPSQGLPVWLKTKVGAIPWGGSQWQQGRGALIKDCGQCVCMCTFLKEQQRFLLDMIYYIYVLHVRRVINYATYLYFISGKSKGLGFGSKDSYYTGAILHMEHIISYGTCVFVCVPQRGGRKGLLEMGHRLLTAAYLTQWFVNPVQWAETMKTS